MGHWWDDLSDEELVSRLTQRGMPVEYAQSWVEYRDTEGAREVIDGFLEGGA